MSYKTICEQKGLGYADENMEAGMKYRVSQMQPLLLNLL